MVARAGDSQMRSLYRRRKVTRWARSILRNARRLSQDFNFSEAAAEVLPLVNLLGEGSIDSSLKHELTSMLIYHLSAVSEDLEKAGLDEKSLKLDETVLRMSEKLASERQNREELRRFADLSWAISTKFESANRPDRASRTIEQAIAIYQLPETQRDIVLDNVFLVGSPIILSNIYFRSGRYAKAVEAAEAACYYAKQEFDRGQTEEAAGYAYALALTNLSAKLRRIKEPASALQMATEADRIYRKYLGTSTDNAEIFIDIKSVDPMNLNNYIGNAINVAAATEGMVEYLWKVAMTGASLKSYRHPSAEDRPLAITSAQTLDDLNEGIIQEYEDELRKLLLLATPLCVSLAFLHSSSGLEMYAKVQNNLSASYRRSGLYDEALESATESVEARRILVGAHQGSHVNDLAKSMMGLAEILLKTQPDRALPILLEGLQLETEIAQLSGFISLSSRLARSRHEEFDGPLQEAIKRLATYVAARRFLIPERKERHHLYSELDGVVSEAAIYLAADVNNPAAAVSFLDFMTVFESRSIRTLSSTSFEAFRKKHPAAAKILVQLFGSDDPQIWGQAQAGSPDIDSLMSTIREFAADSQFLSPRSEEEILAVRRKRPVCYIIVGADRGLSLVQGKDGTLSYFELDLSVSGLGIYLGTNLDLARLPGLASAKLAEVTRTKILPILRTIPNSGLGIKIVPVGRAHWLPIQVEAALDGIDIHLDVIANAEFEVGSKGTCAAVLSGGKDEASLPWGLKEVEFLAELTQLDILEGHNASTANVLDIIKHSAFVHFSCHASADAQFGDDSHLVLSEGQRLTLGQLDDALHKQKAPVFVGLSGCKTARTGMSSASEAWGFPALFLSYGAAVVLATSWNVWDSLAYAVSTTFFSYWASGLTASAAFRSAIVDVESRIKRSHSSGEPTNPTLLPNLRGFCLYGNPDQLWPGPSPRHVPDLYDDIDNDLEGVRNLVDRNFREYTDKEFAEYARLLAFYFEDQDGILSLVDTWERTTDAERRAVERQRLAVKLGLDAEVSDQLNVRAEGPAQPQSSGARTSASEATNQSDDMASVKDRLNTESQERDP